MRITIDNEEVLTDKSFTINEEMLNTSSVILNNVFPKTWEQDKDYVSRFYYPKDYSKCLIVNTPRENKTETRTGSNFQFDIDSPTRYITDFTIEGNTEQQTYSGKNLLPVTLNNLKTYNSAGTWSNNSYSLQGLTWTLNQDGSITVNGTASQLTYINMYVSTTISLISTTGQLYTYSKGISNNNIVLAIYEYVNNSWVAKKYTADDTTPYSASGEQTGQIFRIIVNSGTQLTNVKIYPQLEKGNTATSFEKYVGGTASPNPDYPQEVKVVKGNNLLNESVMTARTSCTVSNKTITTNSINSWNTFFVNINSIRLEKNTNYYATFKAKLDSGTGTLNYGGNLYNGSTYGTQSRVSSSGALSSEYQEFCWKITTTEDNFVGVAMVFQAGSNTTNAVISIKDIMFSKTPNEAYLPYNTIGIKKQSKNLFDYTTSTFSSPNRVNITTENNTITITTTETTTSNNLFFYTRIPDNTLQNGETYTISSENVSGVVQSLKLQLRNKDGSTANKPQVDSVVYDKNYALYVVRNIFATSGTTSIPAGTTAIIKNVQVEKGNQATSYVEHKEAIYPLTLEGNNLVDLSQTQIGVAWNNASNSARAVVYIKCEPSTKYTISYNSKGNLDGIYNFEKANITDTSATAGVSEVTGTKTITTQSTSQYLGLQFNKSSISLNDIKATGIRIEKGTTIFPNFLGKIGNYKDRIYRTSGKNLFDYTKNKLANANFNVNTNIIVSDNSCALSYLKCEPNTTYTISRRNPTAIRFQIATTENEPTISSSLLSIAYPPGDTQTITTPANAHYIVMRFIYNQINDYDTYAKTIQVELGNQATEYEPYGTGEWYLHNEIGKVVLNGSETWGGDSARGYYYQENSMLRMENYLNMLYSNYFLTMNRHTSDIDLHISGYYNLQTYPGQNWIYILYKDMATSSDLKTWLSTHNTEVYYVLATPQEIKIEGTLKGQLDNLWNMVFYNGQNNFNQIVALETNMTMSVYLDYDELLFCGVVENTGEISLNPRYPHYCNLQVLDFKTFLSEGETLDFVIANKTILEAIEQVVDAISEYGFVLGNVNIIGVNDTIGAYSTKDKTAYDVFNYIADITQSRWTTRLIDENTVAIDFYDPSLMPQGTAIEYTNEWFTNNNIINMTFNYSSRDYRNKQVMTSSEVFGSVGQSETKITDGYNTQFMTEQKIGNINSIYVNGVEKTYATNTDKSRGISADFYYKVGDNYFTSDTTLNVGSQISINYTPIVEGRQVITNQAEITRVANTTGRKGIIARYEDRNDAITSTELQKIGQSYIKYKGTAEINLRVETYKNIWNVGDRVYFTSPLEELTTEYMVRSKQINYILTQDKIFYTYELTSSFNSETAINYFDNQRSKAKGNIGEGEYISRNVDIENEGNIIFYDFTATQITITGNNQLASPLSSPLID